MKTELGEYIYGLIDVESLVTEHVEIGLPTPGNTE
jgi:hypothetical protein